MGVSLGVHDPVDGEELKPSGFALDGRSRALIDEVRGTSSRDAEVVRHEPGGETGMGVQVVGEALEGG